MLCHSIEQNVVWVLEILSKKPSKVKGNFSKFSFTSDSVRSCLTWRMPFTITRTLFIAVTHANLYFSLGGIKVSSSVLIVFI